MRRARFCVLLLSGLVSAGLVSAGLFSGDETVESVQSKLNDLPAEGHSHRKAALFTELGRLLYRQGRFDDAAQNYQKALNFDPSRSLRRHIYLYLGKCYESTGRPDKALDAYGHAVSFDRKNWRRHRDLGRIYEEVLLYPEAIESYQTAIKYNRTSSVVYLSLGRTYRKMGLYKKAEEALSTASDLGEDSSPLFFEQSLVYEGTGRYEEAAKAERKSLSSSSPVSDWGRVIYLAALAGDKTLANEGLSQIRNRETLPDTVSFYEELVDLLGRKPDNRLNASVVDATLQKLISAVRAPSNNPQ